MPTAALCMRECAQWSPLGQWKIGEFQSSWTAPLESVESLNSGSLVCHGQPLFQKTKYCELTFTCTLSCFQPVILSTCTWSHLILSVSKKEKKKTIKNLNKVNTKYWKNKQAWTFHVSKKESKFNLKKKKLKTVTTREMKWQTASNIQKVK
jgi:hypothetical protein